MDGCKERKRKKRKEKKVYLENSVSGCQMHGEIFFLNVLNWCLQAITCI